jgi:hypothetical protein
MEECYLRLESLSDEELATSVNRLSRLLKEACDFLGWKGTSHDIERFIKLENDMTLGLNPFVAKIQLDELFEHYDKIFPFYHTLPPHGRIVIDFENEVDGQINCAVLESMLFEDVAALWNHTLSQVRLHEHSDSDRAVFKFHSSLIRATIKAVFNFIEGYINGVGLDISLTMTHLLNAKDLAKVSEWDEAGEKIFMQSLRDKLTQYPKIALGLQHPPLNENKCVELRKILNLESELRHALIHPTPRKKTNELRGREEVFLAPMSIEELGEFCDLAVSLVLRINEVLDGKFGDASSWIVERDTRGFFPEWMFTHGKNYHEYLGLP